MTNLNNMIVSGTRCQPPKIIIYGIGGIGKTTFASKAPKPIFIFTEDGQGVLDLDRFQTNDNPVVSSWEHLMDAITALYNDEHDYRTLVIDSLDMAEPLLWDYAAKTRNQDDIEAFGYGKGYMHAANDARALFAGLDALRRDKDMAIIIIAHSEVKRFEGPDAESYDRYSIKLHKRLGALAHEWCDALLFANYRTHTVKDKERFNNERRRAVGTGERVIYTEERPAFFAKNRFQLPPELPLDWDEFYKYLDKKDTAKKKGK